MELFSTDDDYIAAGLYHPLHTTERKAFRGCPRRWDWMFRLYYYPLVTPRPLEFGVAYHKAMEVWYDPEFWHHPDHHETQSMLALAAFNQITKEQLAEYRRLNPNPDPEKLEEYTENVVLGRKMLEYYTKKISPILDRGLTPIGVEVPFEVSLEFKCKCNVCWTKFKNYIETNRLLDELLSECLCRTIEDHHDFWDGLPVTYGGRIDAVVTDNLGRVYVVDWKTAGRILDEGKEESFLELEDQVTSYLLALWKLGRPVWGFIYHEQKKAVPEPPQELKRQIKGRRFSTSKSANTDYATFLHHVAQEDPAILAAGGYDDYLGWLKLEGPRFFQRHQIHRNPAQLENAWADMVAEAHDIIDNPRVYPQPGRFACTTCAYKAPCLSKNHGEDYQIILDNSFERRTHHYFEDPPRTE